MKRKKLLLLTLIIAGLGLVALAAPEPALVPPDGTWPRSFGWRGKLSTRIFPSGDVIQVVLLAGRSRFRGRCMGGRTFRVRPSRPAGLSIDVTYAINLL